MELRIKFRKAPKTSLYKHIQLGIKALRGNRQDIWIRAEDGNRKKVETMTNAMNKQEHEGVLYNNELWKQIQTTLRQEQEKESPIRNKISQKMPIGSTQEEVTRGETTNRYENQNTRGD